MSSLMSKSCQDAPQLRLACYSSSSENKSLARLAAHTWRHFWFFSGHPSFSIGSLCVSAKEGDSDVYMVSRAHLKDVIVKQNWQFDDTMRYYFSRGIRSNLLETISLTLPAVQAAHDDKNSTSRDAKPIYNTLAFELILRNEPERLATLDDSLLEETLGPSPTSQISAFQYAAALGNVDCLAVLIDKLGVTSPLLVGPDGKLSSGVLACCDARFSFGNHEEVLGFLMRRVSVDALLGAEAVRSFLESASFFGAPWLISFLSSRLKDLDSVQFGESLSLACRKGNLDCARLLLEHGADVDGEEDDEDTPLIVACLCGHTDCLRLLLENGADVSRLDSANSWTPLMVAAATSHADCVRLLLEHGVEVDEFAGGSDFRDNHTTALGAAFMGGEANGCADLLLEHGADVNATSDFNGMTVLMFSAAQFLNFDGFLLLGRGAKVNATDFGGRTALMYAAEAMNESQVEALLIHGADPNIKDSWGDTALTLAEQYGDSIDYSLASKEFESISTGRYDYIEMNAATRLFTFGASH